MSPANAHRRPAGRRVPVRRRATAGPDRRWRAQLWLLGCSMVSLGLAIGLAFPPFLVAMQITTAYEGYELRTRAACLVAGVLVGGVNYVLARLVLGGRLRQSEERYRALIDQSSDLVLVTDRAGHACFVSPSAERLLAAHHCARVKADAAAADGPIDLIAAIDERDRGALAAALRAASPGAATKLVVRIATRHQLRTFDLAIQDLTTDRSVQGLVLTAHDVTDHLELQREMEHRALHDALTGLPNRTWLAERCGDALLEDARTGTSTGLLLIDVDRFKEINDTFGHDYGDELLTQIGLRLVERVRSADSVARLGGDEFAVLLPDIGGLDAATACADRLRAALEAPFLIDDIELGVDASIGVVISGTHGTDATTLLRRADIAMYVAKSRNLGAAAYDPAADGHSPGKVALLGDLRRALERGELVLHYQPKVRISTGEVVGAEALVRWQHPERGLVFPDEFIPLAEETLLIGPLTRIVLDLALRQARAWSDAGRPLAVSVNLSARNLLDDGLPDEIVELLETHGVAPELLELEVTESAIMLEPARAKRLLDQLASGGVRISIDDFGVGYTSLGQLRNLPVSELKIDKSFVMTMDHDRRNALIVQSVIDLGHALDLSLVAEGVESAEILTALADLGCDEAQGYHLSRPVPAAAFDAWCDEHELGSVQATGSGSVAGPGPGSGPGQAVVAVPPPSGVLTRLPEVPHQLARGSVRR